MSKQRYGPCGIYAWDRKADSVTRCDDFPGWGAWFATADRRLALDEVPGGHVSTVFLAVDHNFGPGGAPLLWESMVLGGPLDGEQDRYRTKEEALAGHVAMVARCRKTA